MYALDDIASDLPAFRQAIASRLPYRPLYVKIKLFFGCNLKCQMCNHWRIVREPPLPVERFMQVLEELAALGCRKVHFSGGEPLLRPQTPDLVEHAEALGLRSTLTTNGTLLDKALAKRLVQGGLRGVNVSLDSPLRKVHDQVRGVEGAWKAACRAVAHFRRYAHKGKLTLRINTVVSRLNYLSLAGLPDLAYKLGADAINLIGVDDHCGEHLSLHRRHIAEYNARIAPAIASRALELGLIQQEDEAYPYGREAQHLGRARRGEYAFGWYDDHPCFAPWTHSLVDFNGLVYVCCMTREQTEPLGDLRQSSFGEIWSNAAYRHIREGMFPPQLAACRRCDDFIEQNRRLSALMSSVEEIAPHDEH
jgi:MoaA/NifB/PqqE/SkfB family radical SAM enzyme